jgi:hypothetical protein
MTKSAEQFTQNDSNNSEKHDECFRFASQNNYLPYILMAAIVLLTIFVLHLQGRILWCKWDAAYLLWSSDAWSKHNSQHLFDPYIFTHVLLGILYYAGLFLIFR